MNKFQRIMDDMGWKHYWKHTAKCVWQGCDGLRGKDELLCLWHKRNAEGRPIRRQVVNDG